MPLSPTLLGRSLRTRPTLAAVVAGALATSLLGGCGQAPDLRFTASGLQDAAGAQGGTFVAHVPHGVDAAHAEVLVAPAGAPSRTDSQVLASTADSAGRRASLTGLKDGRYDVWLRWGPHRDEQSSSPAVVDVDRTPPTVSLDPLQPTSLRGELTVTGRTEPRTRLRVEGAPLASGQDGDLVAGPDGRFQVRLGRVPTYVAVVATDPAGNEARMRQPVVVHHPGMRAVHMTALAWTSKALRDPVLSLALHGLIDTVELDIKDEGGDIGYDSQVPLARAIGASHPYYDVHAVVAQLHAMRVRVVGRLVVFRDPRLGAWAWTHGRRDHLVQKTDGTAWGGTYGAFNFTNPFNPEVRAYNQAVAVEAARLGFDDVLFDYIRRPDGKLEQMRFPGATTTPEQAITSFMASSYEAVRAEGAYLGASVFGIAVNRPHSVAQVIPDMSKFADYISPMVYPSHWGPGEYGVAQPNSQPYLIVQRSLADYARAAKGGHAVIIPWLQDFSLGVHYGPAQVEAQIWAAKANGITSFLLWNAGARYQAAALVPTKPKTP